MFQSLKKLISKKENSHVESGLFKSFEPLEFYPNTTYEKKIYSTQYDIKDELLDPSKAKDTLFTIYSSLMKSSDSLLFESINIKLDLIMLSGKVLGREYPKTSSFFIENAKSDISAILEVQSGSGYIILQKTDQKNISIVKVEKNSVVEVPKNYVFVLINKTIDSNLICFCATSKKSNIIKNYLSDKNGTIVYLTETGFVRNKNYEPFYELEEKSAIYDSQENKEIKDIYNDIVENTSFYDNKLNKY